jgi:hypothetical protein
MGLPGSEENGAPSPPGQRLVTPFEPHSPGVPEESPLWWYPPSSVSRSCKRVHQIGLTTHCSGLATRAAEFEVVRACPRDGTSTPARQRHTLPGRLRLLRTVGGSSNLRRDRQRCTPSTRSSQAKRFVASVSSPRTPCQPAVLDRPHLRSRALAPSLSTPAR